MDSNLANTSPVGYKLRLKMAQLPNQSVEGCELEHLEAFYERVSKIPLKFNIAPENRSSKKENRIPNIPTIIFQGLC